MYYLIETGAIRWPQKDKHGFEVSAVAQDLITKLLTKDKMKRLGRDNDVDDVVNHPWFKDIALDELLMKKVQPPFVPQVGNPDDTSHFDEKFSKQEVMESIIDPSKQQLIEKHKEDFETF